MDVAVYARVSSEDQKERQTINNQVDFAKKYCDLHELNIVDWYKDDGVTGTLPLEQRPEGKRLIEDAKQNKFEMLLLYKLDRLGRSARITLNSIHELESYGTKIKSMTEPFDTSNPSGRFMITMLAGVADLERETILERMWYGANRAAREGKWLGGIVPYGYYVDENKCLQLNENTINGTSMSEVEVIKLIYSLIVTQKYSSIKVADYLNSLNIPTSYAKDNRKVAKGKRKINTANIWRPSTVQRIIKNSTYMGLHHYGKRSKKNNREIITRKVPSIVSQETWDKAQIILHDNQFESSRNSTRNYLLRGLIKCGICGLNYCGVSYGSKIPGKAYYICDGKVAYRGPLQGKCTSKNIPAQYLENIVWNDIVNFINYPGKIITQLQNNMDERKNELITLTQQKKLSVKNLEEKKSEKSSILDLYRKKIISTSDVEEQMKKMQDETMSLEKLIHDIEDQIKKKSTMDTEFSNAEQLLLNLKDKIKGDISFNEKRRIVKMLVKKIMIETKTNENGRVFAKINITYSFKQNVRSINGVNLTDVPAAIMEAMKKNAHAVNMTGKGI